jgi:hypothetical protein
MFAVCTMWIGTFGHEGVEEVVAPSAGGLVPPIGAAIDHLFHGL